MQSNICATSWKGVTEINICLASWKMCHGKRRGRCDVMINAPSPTYRHPRRNPHTAGHIVPPTHYDPHSHPHAAVYIALPTPSPTQCHAKYHSHSQRIPSPTHRELHSVTHTVTHTPSCTYCYPTHCYSRTVIHDVASPTHRNAPAQYTVTHHRHARNGVLRNGKRYGCVVSMPTCNICTYCVVQHRHVCDSFTYF